MKASDIIANAMRQYGVPMGQALDRAVSMSKHDRAPRAVQKLRADIDATARIKPFEPPRGEMVMVSARTGYGKTFAMRQHIEYLVQQGYKVQLVQTIQDPPRIIADRDGEPTREWEVHEPLVMFGRHHRRDYWGEAFQSMYRRHRGLVDPDSEALKV